MSLLTYTLRSTSIVALLALAAVPACQPETELADPLELATAWEAAVAEMLAAVQTHGAVITAAADEAALLAEEDTFATSGIAPFEAAVEAAGAMEPCLGMPTMEGMMPDDNHEMMEGLMASFTGHKDTMVAAVDRLAAEQSFQDELEMGHGDGMGFSAEFRVHAEDGMLECAMEGGHDEME